MNIENNSYDNTDMFKKNINLEDTIEFNYEEFNNDDNSLDNIDLEDTINLGGNEYGE